MFCALSQNHQPCVCLPLCFLRGVSSKYVWCKQWRHQIFGFSPYRNTFSPSMPPPPKSGVATGCHWSPWLPAQSLCVVSCSVTKCYLDPPSLAFSNPCFPVFLVYHLNSLHKIVKHRFQWGSQCLQVPGGPAAHLEDQNEGEKWRKFEEKKKRNYGKMRKDWGNVLILPILPTRSERLATALIIFPLVRILRVIACNSGTQMRVRDSSATRIFFLKIGWCNIGPRI